MRSLRPVFQASCPLHFRSDPFVQQPQNWSLRLVDITSVEVNRALGVVPNGMTVTASGRTIPLVVAETDAWVTAIQAAKKD